MRLIKYIILFKVSLKKRKDLPNKVLPSLNLAEYFRFGKVSMFHEEAQSSSGVFSGKNNFENGLINIVVNDTVMISES